MKKSLIIRTGILNFIMCFALFATAGWSSQKVAASPTMRIIGAAEREYQLEQDIGKLPVEPVKDQLVQSEPLPATPMTIGSPIGVNLLISQSSAGALGHPGSASASISADGKRVAFSSPVGNLVPNDNNATDDVFIRDWGSGQTERISVSSAGAQGNGRSWWSEISDNGRFVVFSSQATNLVLTDTNTVQDIFLRDLVAKSTVRVSTSFTGTQANNFSIYGSVSGDGKLVAFSSLASNLVSGDTNGKQDIFVKNMETGALKRISVNNSGTQGNGDSNNPSISGDGNFVAFKSTASNLVDNDGNNWDVFVYNLQTDTIECASVRYTDGRPSNSGSYMGLSRALSNLSFDGSVVAFISFSSNLVIGDNNGKIDAFVRDLELDYTERVSVSSTGVQGNQNSDEVTISSDGQMVAFASLASTLDSGDTNTVIDTYLHELSSGDTHLVSLSNEGELGDNSSSNAALSADGRYLVYHTGATNLLGGGVSSYGQVLLFDPLGIDLQIDSVTPVQVLEDEDLVYGKSTAIKAVVRKLGAQPLTGVMLSANHNGEITYIFYVNEPSNSNEFGFLKNDNTGHMLSFGASEITKTVYLVGDALTPYELISYAVDVDIDPLNGIAEMNEHNNRMTASATMTGVRWGIFPNLDIAFFPLDWGTFDKDDYSTFVNRSSDFLQGVYPVAEERYKMHQWNDVLSTASKRDEYGRISEFDLRNWVRWNHIKLRFANPTIDRFIAVVPWDWFDQVMDEPNVAGMTFPYSALSLVAMRYSDDRSNYNLAAHEVGHNYGMWIYFFVEEYDLANPGYQAPAGFWVNRRMPVDGDPIKYCFMGKRNSDNPFGYWVDESDYHKLVAAAATYAPGFYPTADPRAILTSGTVDITGTATLDNWYVLPEAEYAAMPEGEYTFVYLDASSAVLGEHKVDFWIEGSDWDVLPFSVVIPYLDGTARIELRKGAATLAQKIVSANAPAVQITTPAGGESYFTEVSITWTGSDLDGDPLSYAVLYSSDGGTTWTTADIEIQQQDYTLNLIGLPPGDNYLVRVIATDGVNTGEDVSDAPFEVLNAVFLPAISKP